MKQQQQLVLQQLEDVSWRVLYDSSHFIKYNFGG